MKTLALVSIALLTVTAHATTPPTPTPSPAPTATASAGAGAEATAGAVAGAVAGAHADGGAGGSASAVGNGGAGGAGGTATANGGSSSATSGDASADNSLNLSQHYEAKRNAPSIVASAVLPTASCQSGISIGGSGPGGGGLLGFSFSKRECETVVLAQNFAAIGMPDTACDLLKTTKAWERALKKNADLWATCNPKPDTPAAAAPAPTSINITLPDMTSYVKQDQLAEHEKRIVNAVTGK